jgi:hypothetical protein
MLMMIFIMIRTSLFGQLGLQVMMIRSPFGQLGLRAHASRV